MAYIVLLFCIISLSWLIPIKSDVNSMESKQQFLKFLIVVSPFVVILSIASFYKTKQLKRATIKSYLHPALLFFLGFFLFIVTIGLTWAVGTAIYHEKSRLIREGHINIVKLGEAVIQHAKNNHGVFPDTNNWCDLLITNFENISEETFLGSFDSNGVCDFTFNKNLSACRLADVPGNVVLLFETQGGWNSSGGKELLGTKHKKFQSLVFFVDGQWGSYDSTLDIVKYCVSDKYDYNPLRWKP